MAVVPQNMIERLMEAQREQQQLVSDSPMIQLSNLDEQMKRIIDSAEPSDVKAKHYEQIIQTYFNIRSKDDQPIATVQPVNPAWLTGLGKSYASKGKMLEEFVKSGSGLQWNEKNEIIYKGNRIAGSNIIDLIHTFSKPKVAKKPVGWKEFGSALIDNNVPRAAIGNEKLLNVVVTDNQTVLLTPVSKHELKAGSTVQRETLQQRRTTRRNGPIKRTMNGDNKKWIPHV